MKLNILLLIFLIFNGNKYTSFIFCKKRNYIKGFNYRDNDNIINNKLDVLVKKEIYSIKSSFNYISITKKGFDERFTKNITYINETTCNEMQTIKDLYRKKQILDTLNSNKVSIYTKLSLIEQNDIEINDTQTEYINNGIKPFNLKAGGLFKNSDFDF
jgi:hypothetical protein